LENLGRRLYDLFCQRGYNSDLRDRMATPDGVAKGRGDVPRETLPEKNSINA